MQKMWYSKSKNYSKIQAPNMQCWNIKKIYAAFSWENYLKDTLQYYLLFFGFKNNDYYFMDSQMPRIFYLYFNFAYHPFLKTLPITSLQMHWISVRFYEMGVIWTLHFLIILFFDFTISHFLHFWTFGFLNFLISCILNFWIFVFALLSCLLWRNTLFSTLVQRRFSVIQTKKKRGMPPNQRLIGLCSQP